MNPDHAPYYRFTSKSRLDKTINTLLGIVQGISIDSEINETETRFLQEWVEENRDAKLKHPYNELIPVVETALLDGTITSEEYRDINWLCEKLTSREYYDTITTDLQRLHAIMGGILSDGIIKESELLGLSDWLKKHNYLSTCYPYDEVDALVLSVMADKKISPDEHGMLRSLFSEFTAIHDEKVLKSVPIYDGLSVKGVCAVCPQIVFDQKWFCFTGAFQKHSRTDLKELIYSLGGLFTDSIRKDLDYLVIGSDGNPCWAYACYGRKVEEVVSLRKTGMQVSLVHEYDFLDATMDAA